MKTKGSDKSSADICRANGWHRGTIIKSDYAEMPYPLRITAIGDRNILASPVDMPDIEGIFMLQYSSWEKVTR